MTKGYLQQWSFTMVLYYDPLLCFSKCLKYQMAISSLFFIIVIIMVLYYRPLLWSFIIVHYYRPLLWSFIVVLYYGYGPLLWSFIMVLYYDYGPLLSSFIIVLYYHPLLSWLYSYVKHEMVVSSLSSIMTYCSPLLWSCTMVLYFGPN